LKSKNEESEEVMGGAGGVFKSDFSLKKKSEKSGGSTIPQFI
jgi:hypothetical protein